MNKYKKALFISSGLYSVLFFSGLASAFGGLHPNEFTLTTFIQYSTMVFLISCFGFFCLKYLYSPHTELQKILLLACFFLLLLIAHIFRSLYPIYSGLVIYEGNDGIVFFSGLLGAILGHELILLITSKLSKVKDTADYSRAQVISLTVYYCIIFLFTHSVSFFI